jgi:D-alanyl-D-alanine-carboxypeptidase/D-alanyl-D-alanine-endopeptidase
MRGSLLRVLLGTFVGLFAGSDGVAGAQSDRGDLGSEVAPIVAPWVDEGFFPGVTVGVARGDDRWSGGFGETAVGSGVVPDARTLYEIGSLTKVYTGLLLADAHLRGTARLDDTLERHLPKGTVLTRAEGVPIRLLHLATHTSGLQRLPSNLRPTDADPYASYDGPALLQGLVAARPRHVPGTVYAYSNFGAGVLGYVLARREGVASFDELFVSRLAVVHGFDDTRVQPDSNQLPRLAPPHDAALRPGTSWGFDALAAAGGLRSSTEDLLRFACLFFDGAQHPHAAAAELARAVHLHPEDGPAMGLGWHHREIAGIGDVLAHEGQTGSYHSVLLVAPRARLAVTVLANAPCERLGRLGITVLQRVAGAEVAPHGVVPRVPLAEAALTELPGRYAIGPFDSVRLEAVEGVLFAARSMRPTLRLHAVGPDAYEFRVVPGGLEVVRDTDGIPRSLRITMDGETAEAVRR